EETFPERLPDEIAAAGAEGDADGELLPADIEAGEEEVGEIDARDGEDAGDGAGEDEEGAAELAAQGVVEGADGRAGIAGEVETAAQTGIDDIEFGLGLRDGDAG